MSKALVTLTVGHKSQAMWQSIFAPSWRAYADIHGYEVIQLTDRIRDDDRHPSWHKLCIFDLPEVRRFDRVVWLDHDVMVNPNSPCIASIAADGRVGAVTWTGSYQRDPVYFESAFSHNWRNNTLPWIREKIRSFSDIMVNAGYDPVDNWLNAGVLSFDPSHADLLNEIYEGGRVHKESSLEQTALIHWLCGLNPEMLDSLDRRFNVIWNHEVNVYYPFLHRLPAFSDIVYECVQATMNRSFFVHFLNGPPRQHAATYRKRQLAEAA
jgi:hypothetical protein